MEPISQAVREVLILLFILIVFLQSGIDKLVDWNGNTSWLKEHFASTFLSGSVPFVVGIVMVLEILTGIAAMVSVLWIIAYGANELGLLTCSLASLTLLMLLFGQRIAKDYAGAFTLTGYFIITIFGVYIMS